MIYMFLDMGLDKHKGILESLTVEHDEYGEVATESILMDNEYDTVIEAALDVVLEAKDASRPKGHILDKKTRDALPDSAFGIPSDRKYPLIVENDLATSKELIARAIQFFHFANPKWKPELAKNIINAIDQTGADIKIHPKSAINRFVTVPSDLISNDTENKYHSSK